MNKDISRRAFLTGAAVLGTTSIVGATGCADQTGVDKTSVGGTVYEGTGKGLKGNIKVAIKMSSDNQTIEDVWVIEKEDSPFISDVAAKEMGASIIAYQSLNVDTVSGATLTSRGILEGARQALEDGGIDISPFEAAPDVVIENGDDIECDILIIGGGASGLTAAIAACTDDTMSAHAKSDLKVILVEQLAYTGGCIRVSDSSLWAPNNTRYNLAAVVSASDDTLVEYTKSNPINEFLNEELWRNILAHIPVTFQSLLDRGLYMPVSDAIPGLLAPGIPGPLWQVRNPVTAEAPMFVPVNGFIFSENAGGPYLAESLEYCALDAGADIRKSTKVEELVVTGTEITGVRVTDKVNRVEYLIHPKQVILATGCVGANAEMVEEFEPSSAGAIHFGSAGTTGDGIAWMKDNGGAILPGMIHYVVGPDSKLGHYGPCSILRNYAPCVKVNLDGERFYNEGQLAENVESESAEDLAERTKKEESSATYLSQKDNKGFGIMSGDDVADFQEQLDYAVDHGVAWKADTLEELANEAGIDVEGLMATIEKYRKDYDAGKGSDFGITHEQMIPIAETGPYYAFLQRSLFNLLDYGVKVDTDCRPVKADGSLVFENIHTAGSIMVSNYSFMWHGISHATALTSGSYVGNLARHEIEG